MAHPLRIRMLSLLTGAELSAAEVARELGISHANASYHLRVLLDVGEIVEAGEETIRGGIAKRYRYPHGDDVPQPSGRPPAGATDRVAYLKAVHSDVERRAMAGSPTVPMSHFDLDGWVPPEVAEEARKLLEEASVLLHRSNVRPGTDGTVHVSATATVFLVEDER